MMKSKITGAIGAGLVLLIWGVTFACTRALLFDFSALEIQVVRFFLAWISLLTLGFVKREAVLKWRGKNELLFAVMGLSGVVVYQFLENCAIYYTNASNVAILVSFGPIVTAALARIFTRERTLTPSLLIGSAVAIAGVSLVSLNGILNFKLRPLGDMMAFGAMISWGVYSILIDKANERGISPLVAICKAFFWSLVICLPFAFWGTCDSGFYALDGSFSINLDATENALRFGHPLNLFNLGFLGVLASAAAFVLWSKACAALGVVSATVCLYLVPVIGVVFATAFLGERLTLMSTAGGVIIICGVVIANWRKLK